MDGLCFVIIFGSEGGGFMKGMGGSNYCLLVRGGGVMFWFL